MSAVFVAFVGYFARGKERLASIGQQNNPVRGGAITVAIFFCI